MAANCDNCRHHVGPELGRDRRRECRAHAPAFARECQTPAYGPLPVFLACWPLTLPADGCGHWAPIPAPPPPPVPAPAAAPEAPPAAPATVEPEAARKPRKKGE